MKERTLVLMVCVFLIGLSVFVVYFFPEKNQKFNFHKVELKINGNLVEETLYYKPDKNYRTFYRRFVDSVYLSEDENPPSNSIYIYYGGFLF